MGLKAIRILTSSVSLGSKSTAQSQSESLPPPSLLPENPHKPIRHHELPEGAKCRPSRQHHYRRLITLVHYPDWQDNCMVIMDWMELML